MDFPIIVKVNGVIPNSVHIHYNLATKQYEVTVAIPHLERYSEFIKDLDNVPTIDHVMFNWRRKSSEDSSN